MRKKSAAQIPEKIEKKGQNETATRELDGTKK